MLSPRQMLRLSRMARRRPQMWQVWLFLGIAIAAALIFAVEWMGWAPEWMQSEPTRLPQIRPLD